MSKFELKLPRMGESVAEATLTSWLKEVGDTIEMDEPIFEIATDKVDSEVQNLSKRIKKLKRKSLCYKKWYLQQNLPLCMPGPKHL